VGYAHLRKSRTTKESFEAHGQVDFHAAEIGGECEFDDAIVKPDWRPLHPSFRMDSGRFADKVSLDRACIDGGAVFDKASIAGDLGIDQTRLASNLNSIVPALSLSFAKIGGRLVWRPKSVSGAVSLRHAELGILDDEKGSWSGCLLDLRGFTYSDLGARAASWSHKERLDWLKTAESKAESQPYDQIIKTLRESGRESDAREIAIEKQKLLRAFAWSNEPTPDSRWPRLSAGWNSLLGYASASWSWFLRNTVGYGYKPWRAFGLALILVAVGTFVFYVADRNQAMMPTSNWARPQPGSEVANHETRGARASYPSRVYVENGYPQFIAPVYALDALLPIINLRQRDFWLPNPINRIGKVALGYLWLETLAGWALAAALVARLVRTREGGTLAAGYRCQNPGKESLSACFRAVAGEAFHQVRRSALPFRRASVSLARGSDAWTMREVQGAG
jgi:hypothetical protein